MTPDLKEILCSILRALEVLAKKTANPIDDIVIKGLKAMLGCK